MPNYKMTENMRDHMVRHARALCERRVFLWEDDFPLDVPEIEAIVTKPDVLSAMKFLRAEGVNQNTEKNMQVFLGKHQFGLDRAVAVQLQLPTEIVCPYQRGVSRAGTHLANRNASGYGRQDNGSPFTDLSPAQAVAVGAWAKRALRERRIMEFVVAFVATVLKHCEGTLDLLAAMPSLVILAEGEREYVNKFRAPTRMVSKYGASLRAHLASVAAARPDERTMIETHLAACALLDKHDRDRSKVIASVLAWEQK